MKTSTLRPLGLPADRRQHSLFTPLLGRNQYARADKSGIRTVIFNGGGNDIQLNSCRPSLTACMPLLNELEDRIAALVQANAQRRYRRDHLLGYYNAVGSAIDLHDINNYSMNYKAPRPIRHGFEVC
ncbi:hypothetical protein ULF88_18650 [Halopseudomonas pachastrellae]|nr:hypothetical protein [Halopseudomonas pachastrellae]